MAEVVSVHVKANEAAFCRGRPFGPRRFRVLAFACGLIEDMGIEQGLRSLYRVHKGCKISTSIYISSYRSLNKELVANFSNAMLLPLSEMLPLCSSVLPRCSPPLSFCSPSLPLRALEDGLMLAPAFWPRQLQMRSITSRMLIGEQFILAAHYVILGL